MTAAFVVLPDTAAAAALPARTAFAPLRAVPHASGRPWLVGSWPEDRMTVATAGPVRVAVIGDSPVGAERLTRLAGAVRSVSDVDGLASALAAPVHVVASVDGRVRAQGSVSGLCRLFHTRHDGVDVASDRADVLARMVGAPVDEQSLAVRMAAALGLTPPLDDRPPWAGVSPLAPGRCLVWDGGRAREHVWWHPPAPDLPARHGAAALRDALTAAVADRAPAGGRLSADLSGSPEALPLCFLAARHTPTLLTLRWDGDGDRYGDGDGDGGDAGGDGAAGGDALCAGLAAAALPHAEHLVVPHDELPSVFAVDGIPTGTEQPLVTTRGAARLRHTARLLARHGSRRHLAGHGGDALFPAPPGYPGPLLLPRPLLAVRRPARQRTAQRRTRRPALTGTLHPGTVAGWWRARQDAPAAGPSHRAPAVGWGLPAARAPSWFTPACVDLVHQALQHGAERAGPLSRDVGQHQTLLAVRAGAAHHRLLARVFADAGVRLDLPYHDQRVLEAVLRVRPHEPADGRRCPPLLEEAMRGIVPAAVRDRAAARGAGCGLPQGSAGVLPPGTAEPLPHGLARQLPALLDLFAGSALARAGLVDADGLRAELQAPGRGLPTARALEALLGCELWLRAVRHSAAGAGRPGAPRARAPR